MERPTVEQATAELMHIVANHLLIAGEARAALASGLPRVLTDAEVGAHVIKYEPDMRAAFDALKAAQIREALDAEDEPTYYEASDDKAALVWEPEGDEDCERYHAAKDDRLTDAS